MTWDSISLACTIIPTTDSSTGSNQTAGIDLWNKLDHGFYCRIDSDRTAATVRIVRGFFYAVADAALRA